MKEKALAKTTPPHGSPTSFRPDDRLLSFLNELIPNMPAERLGPLIERYREMLNEQRVFKEVFGVL